MIFYEHHSHEAKQIEPENVQPAFRHLLISHAIIYITTGDFGLVISQKIRETDFTVWQHHFFIDRDCLLKVYNPTPIVTINYMFQGSPLAKLEGTSETLLQEDTYRLFYVPIIEHRVSFITGQYHSAHISYDPILLKATTSRHRRLSLLLDYTIQDEDKIIPHKADRISLAMKMKVLDLLWYSAPGGRYNYIQRIARELLLQYALRHHAMKDELALVESYMDERLDETLNVPQLARYCCMSLSELYRLFKLQYDTSPYQHFQDKRAERIKHLLLTTTKSNWEIARLLGFESKSGFYKFFRRYFKMSPYAFRNLHKSKALL